MMNPELAGLLAGPAPADMAGPALPGGGMPPELAGLMGPPALPAMPEDLAEPAQQTNASASEFINLALEDLAMAIEADPDVEDKALLETCRASLRRVLAKNQKEEDAALGVTPQLKYVRRQQ